jgi:hypothetical protein
MNYLTTDPAQAGRMNTDKDLRGHANQHELARTIEIRQTSEPDANFANYRELGIGSPANS